MQNFTNYGREAINSISQRYGISTDAVAHMLIAVSNGGGTMAQFNCPELGGGGQWMQGGMTMVGDMFNNGLKNTVDSLCGELSNLLYNQNNPIFAPIQRRASSQSSQQQYQGDGHGQNSIFISGGNQGNWWIEDLGQASSTGGQNNVRYAIFPQSRRLAIEINGSVTIYDTLDHQIGGVSQQQSGDSSMSFTSQYGLVYVSQLPVISIDGNRQESANSQPPQAQPAAPAPQNESPQPVPIQENQFEPAESELEHDIFDKIERLAGLKDKGILSEEEYSTKKAELLARL
ncbi:SHOCT domain-containing protein [Pelagicoccus sp. SDUM812002]|uniref:SHOCT domain-containing protein n=1 Tax=Pelagicoccus sp. SDUM812002 TaxID=3041266 RepID=UPI00280DD492|nr:SHOCT domain-containing protein [Pelagicoccus sp. SDUM812002]MDQ8184675.1 SHOCT domain-containing protein [Pelagicoccus sp. SDUM812002]